MPVPSAVQHVRVTRGGSPPAKRVLRAADLTYLGVLGFPTTGSPRIDFAYGQIAGRVVGGQQRIFLSGNVTLQSPIYEYIDPGTYGTNAAPKRMALAQAWGDVYHGKRMSWNPDGSPRQVARWEAGGLFWHEASQLLYWTYYDSYNVSGIEDWCLGASQLNADGTSIAYGPWRPAGPPGSGNRGPYKCTRTALAPDGTLLCGTRIGSGNKAYPWGPDGWTGAWPTRTTPGGYGTPDLPLQKYLTYYFYAGSINQQDGSFTPPIRSARRPGDYFFEPLPNMGKTQIDPTKNGGVGSWTEMDAVGGFTWIDLPDVHGVVYSLMLGAGHIWYSNAGVGNLNCFHGVPPPVAITGPVMTDGHPTLMCYDPTDLTAVRAGAKTDFTVDPIDTVAADSRWGIKTAGITQVGSAKAIVGQYFNPQTRKLYICAPEADVVVPNQYYLPLIHVWQVA